MLKVRRSECCIQLKWSKANCVVVELCHLDLCSGDFIADTLVSNIKCDASSNKAPNILYTAN